MSDLVTALLVIGGLVVVIAAVWGVIAVANLLMLGGGPGGVERAVADKWWIPWLFVPPAQSRHDRHGGSYDDEGVGHHHNGHEHGGFDGGHHSE
jgi:hypothetical protein